MITIRYWSNQSKETYKHKVKEIELKRLEICHKMHVEEEIEKEIFLTLYKQAW